MKAGSTDVNFKFMRLGILGGLSQLDPGLDSSETLILAPTWRDFDGTALRESGLHVPQDRLGAHVASSS